MCSLNFLLILIPILFVTTMQITPTKAAPPRIQINEKDIAVKRCREKCILKLLGHFNDINIDKTISQCDNSADCLMCWDYCHAIVVAQKPLAYSMCGDDVFCTAGCQTACKYHKIKTKNKLIDSIAVNEV